MTSNWTRVAEYPHVLTSIILQNDEAAEERQLAAVLLKLYIQAYWWRHHEDCDPGLKVPLQMKQAIRHELPYGLAEPIGKLQSTIAVALAHIADLDGIEYWHLYKNMILTNLSSADENLITGTLKFLSEWRRIIEPCLARHVLSITESLIEIMHNKVSTLLVFFYFYKLVQGVAAR